MRRHQHRSTRIDITPRGDGSYTLAVSRDGQSLPGNGWACCPFGLALAVETLILDEYGKRDCAKTRPQP